MKRAWRNVEALTHPTYVSKLLICNLMFFPCPNDFKLWNLLQNELSRFYLIIARQTDRLNFRCSTLDSTDKRSDLKSHFNLFCKVGWWILRKIRDKVFCQIHRFSFPTASTESFPTKTTYYTNRPTWKTMFRPLEGTISRKLDFLGNRRQDLMVPQKKALVKMAST